MNSESRSDNRRTGRRLLVDIASEEARARYPSHGWSTNSQGVKLLWLPVVRLTQFSPSVRAERGVRRADGSVRSAQAFSTQVRRLAIVLREIAKLEREAVASAPGTSPEAGRANRFQSSLELLEVHVDLAFVYLRRIADRLGHAARYVLFEKPGSAPRTLHGLADKKDAELQSLDPMYEETTLRAALTSQLRWLHALRGPGSDGQLKGLRDLMEHAQSFTLGGVGRAGDGPWEVDVFLAGADGVHTDERELLYALRSIVAGFCSFATELHRSTRWGDGYEAADHIYFSGDDEDGVRFWPQI